MLALKGGKLVVVSENGEENTVLRGFNMFKARGSDLGNEKPKTTRPPKDKEKEEFIKKEEFEI